jgi:cytoskeletal protein CcmA (bactofilin family)
MFSRKVDAARPPVASTAQPAAPKRTVQSGSVPSIISSDVVVTGTLTSTGEIQINGRVAGTVRCVSLIIGKSGQIHGEVLAGDVAVSGQVKGRIYAHRVRLGVSSRVEGDILHAVFAIEAGAFFEGNCRHSDNPLAAASKKIAEISAAVLPMRPAAVAQSVTPIPHLAYENGRTSPSLPQTPPSSVLSPQHADAG